MQEPLMNIIKKILMQLPPVKARVDVFREMRSDLAEKTRMVAELERLISNSRSPGLFQNDQDFLTERLMAHPVKKKYPRLTLASSPPIENIDRVGVAERLLAAYTLTKQEGAKSPLQREGDDMWSNLLKTELSDIGEVLDKGDPVELAEQLKNFGNSYTWFGGISTSIDGYNRNLEREQVALTYLDKLVCLAESVGALNVENPESGPWGDNLFAEVNVLVDKIEQSLGISIDPPLGIVHIDGIETQKGIFHYRHLNSIYMAHRISRLAPENGPVAEIGGGIGLTAMYARRLGFKVYTIYDLPFTNILIGHYLIHALGQEKVSLYGENYDGDGIQVLPFWEFHNLPSKSIDITVSQDTLPEITDNLIKGYLENTVRVSNNYFLSSNHEVFAPRTVNNFVNQTQGMEPMYRFKNWVREGYVEECYKIV